MALKERLQAAMHAFTAPQPQQKNLGSQMAWNTIFTTGVDQLMGYSALTMPYAQHPTVYAAISAIAQSISALPLEMFPAGANENDEPIEDSIVAKLLENPSPDMDGPMLLEGTIDFMELYGDAFWFLDGYARRDPKGPQFPTSITLWDPCRVKEIVVGSRLTQWEYHDKIDTFRVPPETVIQFKHFNPYDPIRGLAPLSAATIAAKGGYKALQYQESFFENSAIPAGILSPKGDGQIIQPEAMLRLRDEWEARHMGGTKRGRIGALNSQIEFTELGTTQKDMDFPVWLDAASAFILMVFKVPPSVAGLQKDANYNASVQQAKQFWFNHLPLVHYIERRIKLRLCKQFGIAEEPFFKTESIKAMTEDQLAVSEIARNYSTMAVPFDQINSRMELGFDTDYPAAKIPWIPFSMRDGNEQMDAGLSTTTAPPTGNAAAGNQNGPGDQTNPPQAGKSLQANRELHRKMSWRTLISKVHTEEEAYARAVRQHMFQLRSEVMTKLRTRKAVKIGDINVETLMFDEDKAAKDLEKKVEPIYKSSIEKGADTVIRELQLNIDFSLLSPEVSKFLQEKMFEIADLVDVPLADSLRAQLDEGIRLGESVDKIADRVSEVFDSQRFRAYRIARTEVAESFNGGRYATMKEAGVERIEWLSARDDRVRDSHQEVDGETIVLGDRFSNGLLYPLDPAGPPEEIVNCRCVSLPVA